MALKENQLRAAQMVFENKSSEAIGQAIGVHRNTVDVWRKLPAFKEVVEELERDFLETTKRRARKGAAVGVSIQIQLASGKDEEGNKVDHNTRLAAANQLTKYLPLVAPVETKVDVSGKLETTTPDIAEAEARAARIEEEKRALEAELAELQGQDSAFVCPPLK